MNKDVLAIIVQRFLEEKDLVQRNGLRGVYLAVELSECIATEYPRQVGCPCCNYPRCGHNHG